MNDKKAASQREQRLADPFVKGCVSAVVAVLAIAITVCWIIISKPTAYKFYVTEYYLTGAQIIAVLFLAFVIERRRDFELSKDKKYRVLILINAFGLVIGGLNTLRVLAIENAGLGDLILMTWPIAFSMTSLALSFIRDKDDSESVLDQGRACSQVLRLLQPRSESPGGGAEDKPGPT